jgi:hypothetical protein
VTVRIRLASLANSVIAPIRYEFGNPAIVRTLLRELVVMDAGERVSPAAMTLGASSVPNLVSWLEDLSRRLPVVVITPKRDTGLFQVDEGELARQLAGVAHVRALAATQAVWELTNVVGQQLSVWDGGVRIYFPGQPLGDDPRRHRWWIRDRVDDRLVGNLRSWLGTLSSSRTPEHPALGQLRRDRRARLREASEGQDAEFLLDYIDVAEQGEREATEQLRVAEDRNVELESEMEELQAELDAVRRNFGAVTEAHAVANPSQSRDVPASDAEVLTVRRAVEIAQELASTSYYEERVEVTPAAFASARAFSAYRRPEEMLRAIQAVMECSALVHDGRLGSTPMTFFSQRGLGYGAMPSPHLKVDEATSADQCLRIYWDNDPNRRLWRITHIGEHQ